MNTDNDVTLLPSSAELAEVARLAGHAPSIHNSQPWRWRVSGRRLELYAEVGRQLAITDPGGRLMVVSCGASLHHVRVGLAAGGWRTTVDRLPDSSKPELLARVTVTGRIPVTPDAIRLREAISARHTDRRPIADTPVGPTAVAAIRDAVDAQQARLHVLRPDDVLDLAVAASRAQTLEALDARWREEVAYWAGDGHPAGRGIPDRAIPARAPQTTVPGRYFGHGGTLPVSAGHDHAAVFAILYGDEDTPLARLRGGEALSAGWLAATAAGVSLLPLSAAVEVDATREVLRRLLAHLGEPYLVVRLGLSSADDGEPPRTPRLPADQAVEVHDGTFGPC